MKLPPSKYKLYHDALLTILAESYRFLTSASSFPLATAPYTSALDAATYAVTLLENHELFNSGHGAVFTRDGVNELEASIMVSKGKKKRGVGVMGLQHVKNPIKLAREMLLHGETDLEGGNGEHRDPSIFGIPHMALSSGAQGHCQLHKIGAERLAEQWGLEMVDPSYFFVQARWDEHIKGLEAEKKEKRNATWHEKDFFPQGTCGAVALDTEGVICCATSTGGMTNKLSGRIGDTPTLGAGFWAEEWEDSSISAAENLLSQPGPALVLSETFKGMIADCFPSPTTYSPLPTSNFDPQSLVKGDRVFRSTGMSGTGNGDSFLRINAVRTASAIVRYRGKTSLQAAINEISGSGGELAKSAGNRWGRTGEGEGGIIGVEMTILTDENGNTKSAVSNIAYDFNCGGMFCAAVNRHGKAIMRVWKPDQHSGLEKYEGEGKEYDLSEW